MRSAAPLIALTLYLLAAAAGSAEPRLQDGMQMNDVLRALGPARDKALFETKREERWHYAGLSVVFRDGLLASWSASGAARFAADDKPSAAARQGEEAPLSPAALGELWSELQSASTEAPEESKPGAMRQQTGDPRQG